MKNNGKSSKPIIAAHSAKQNSNEPAPPENSKNSEAQGLRAAHQNMRSIVLERISDGLLGFDPTMNHIYVDERAGELLGREPGAILGKNFWEEYPEAAGSPFADACQRAFETQTVVPFEGYFPPSDSWFEGRVYPSSDGLSVLLNGDREPKKKQSGQFSEFPLQNPNPVMRFGRDGKLLFANPASAALLENWKQRSAEGIPPELQQSLSGALESGSHKELEFKNAGKTYAALLVPVQEPGYVNLYFNDITERKAAEESARALISQATTGITRSSLEGRFLFANQAFCDMLGYSEAELVGRSLWEISHPADIAKNRRLFERLASDGEPYQLEKRLLRRNGTIVWVSVGTSALRDSEGNIYAAVSVIVDITRRKRAEESLLDSARRTLYLSSLSDTLRPLSSPAQIEQEATRILGLYLKASRVVYAQVDGDGTVTVNNTYTNGAADRKGIWSIDQIIPVEMLSKFRLGGAVVTSGAETASLGGEPFLVSLQTQIVIPVIRQGEVVAALLVQQSQAREWTSEEIHLAEETAERMQAAMERARAERDLRESEKRFRILSNTVPSMVWSTAADGTVQYLNEHWHNYTGLGLDESVTNWANLVLHPDDYEQYVATWRHALASAPEEYLAEGRYRRYDGQYRWFQSRATPARDENGNVVAWYGVSTDIHDRVEREAELQQIMNNTPFMFTRCSRDLYYRFVSRAYAEMVGRRPEELAGKPIVESMGEAGVQAILPYVEQVLQGKRVEYEMEVPFAGAKRPFLHVTYVPDYDSQGNVIGWFASIVDLGERRQIENALRESERKFSLIYDHLPFVAVLSDAQTGLLVDVNETFEKVFGYSRAQVIGKAPREVGIKGGEQNREVVTTALQTSGLAHNFEMELIMPDGSTRMFLVNIDTVEINGKSYRLSTLQDITERTQMENQLRASEEKYRRIVETANEGIWEIDKDTRTVFVNQRMADMLGYTPEEMMGRSSFEFVAPEDYPDGENRLQIAKSGKGARASEFRYRHKSGSYLWTIISSTPKLDQDGNFMGAIAMFSDITERKQYEKSLIEFARHQSALYKLADQLHRTYTLQEMYDASLDAIRRALLCDRASILLFDGSGVMRFVAWDGLSEEYRQATDGHSPWKADEKNPVPIAIANIHNSDLSDSLKAVIAKEGIGSLAFIPILFQGRLIGKFMVYFNTPHIFSDSELDLSTTIARQLASVVDRKRNEYALRESQQRLALVYNHAAVGLVETAPDTRLLECNDEFCKMSGYTKEELLGRSLLDITYEEDATAEKDLYRQLMTKQIPFYRIEKRYVKKDGALTWGEVVRSVVLDENDQARFGLGAVFDINERKQREEALRARTEELKAARRRAEETASRIARLQKVTAALSAPLNLAQVAEVLATQATTAFDAVSGTVMMLSADGQTLETKYSMFPASVILPFQRFPVTMDVPAAEAVRTGQVVWIESRQFYLEHYPHLAEQIKQWDDEAGIAVPLEYKGRISGVLILTFDHAMLFNIEDQEFALTLARQGAQALERARAEEALRGSEERYRAIINQTTVGIVRKDAVGNLLFVNQAFCEMLGYTSLDLMGKSMWELTHPDDAEENRQVYIRMMDEGTPFEYEKRLIHRDGSIHWMMVSVSPLMDIQGRPESAVAVYADITLRKRFESELQRLNLELESRVQQRTAELQTAYESLRANEEKLRKVFEILPVGISFLGNEGQILEMNSALSTILGLSKRALMEGGYRPRRYIRPDGTLMPAAEFASTRALQEQKAIHNVETGIIKENGQVIWTSVNAAPVDIADVDVVVATIDITERKKAEDALHQNRERLKTLSRRLVEVQEEERQALARELHDRVGQNLAALNLNLNILRSQLSSESLQTVGTRLDDSVSLVNQILTITRSVMADLRSNVLDDYGLESALREYADQFTQRTGVEVVADKSGIAIPRLEPSIEMTLLRIAQEALANVARHAQASKATISVSSDNETVYMTIQDDGIGILSWQKANQPGSHGLRIIRERAEAFGGSLTVHSTYKKGTRIEVKIPLINTNPQPVSRKRRS